jgi:hypothetical protein
MRIRNLLTLDPGWKNLDPPHCKHIYVMTYYYVRTVPLLGDTQIFSFFLQDGEVDLEGMYVCCISIKEVRRCLAAPESKWIRRL